LKLNIYKYSLPASSKPEKFQNEISLKSHPKSEFKINSLFILWSLILVVNNIIDVIITKMNKE